MARTTTPRRKATPKKGSRRHARRKTGGARAKRLARFMDAQQRAIERWSDFVEDSARRSLSGSLTPSEWFRSYARVWQDMADDLAEMARAVLKE